MAISRSLVLASLTLAALVTPAQGQEVYGRVWLNQEGTVEVAGGATVRVGCPASQPTATREGVVSDNGTYRMPAPTTGRCEVRVSHGEKDSINGVVVYVTDARTRVNLELLPAPGGWQIRRR